MLFFMLLCLMLRCRAITLLYVTLPRLIRYRHTCAADGVLRCMRAAAPCRAAAIITLALRYVKYALRRLMIFLTLLTPPPLPCYAAVSDAAIFATTLRYDAAAIRFALRHCLCRAYVAPVAAAIDDFH